MDTVKLPKELTAENGAKGLLSGEFFEEIEIECPECHGVGDDTCEVCEDMGTITQEVPVSWTTIKAIYKMVVENLQ